MYAKSLSASLTRFEILLTRVSVDLAAAAGTAVTYFATFYSLCLFKYADLVIQCDHWQLNAIFITIPRNPFDEP